MKFLLGYLWIFTLGKSTHLETSMLEKPHISTSINSTVEFPANKVSSVNYVGQPLWKLKLLKSSYYYSLNWHLTETIWDSPCESCPSLFYPNSWATESKSHLLYITKLGWYGTQSNSNLEKYFNANSIYNDTSC